MTTKLVLVNPMAQIQECSKAFMLWCEFQWPILEALQFCKLDTALESYYRQISIEYKFRAVSYDRSVFCKLGQRVLELRANDPLKINSRKMCEWGEAEEVGHRRQNRSTIWRQNWSPRRRRQVDASEVQTYFAIGPRKLYGQRWSAYFRLTLSSHFLIVGRCIIHCRWFVFNLLFMSDKKKKVDKNIFLSLREKRKKIDWVGIR